MLYSRAVEVGCYSCGEPTRRRCRECRQPYCSLHGEVICDDCRHRAEDAARQLPVSVLYSPLLLRVAFAVALAGLLLGFVPDAWARLAPSPEDAPPPVATQPPAAPTPAPLLTPAAPTATVTATATAEPSSESTATATATEPPADAEPEGEGDGDTGDTEEVVVRYTVAEGDDLRSIAEQFGVSTETIIAYNGLSDPDHLEPGLELLIPQ